MSWYHPELTLENLSECTQASNRRWWLACEVAYDGSIEIYWKRDAIYFGNIKRCDIQGYEDKWQTMGTLVDTKEAAFLHLLNFQLTRFEINFKGDDEWLEVDLK